jgi:hypothetical protein
MFSGRGYPVCKGCGEGTLFCNSHPSQIIEDVANLLILSILNYGSRRQRQLPKLDVAGSIPVSRSTRFAIGMSMNDTEDQGRCYRVRPWSARPALYAFPSNAGYG